MEEKSLLARGRSAPVLRGWSKAIRLIVGLVFITTGWLKLSGHNIRDGFRHAPRGRPRDAAVQRNVRCAGVLALSPGWAACWRAPTFGQSHFGTRHCDPPAHRCERHGSRLRPAVCDGGPSGGATPGFHARGTRGVGMAAARVTADTGHGGVISHGGRGRRVGAPLGACCDRGKRSGICGAAPAPHGPISLARAVGKRGLVVDRHVVARWPPCRLESRREGSSVRQTLGLCTATPSAGTSQGRVCT